MRFSTLCCAVMIPCLALAHTFCEAEDAGALKLDDLLGAREFGQLTLPAVSPDQEWVVYAAHGKPDRSATSVPETTQASIPWYAKGLDLYAVNTRTGETRNITGGASDNWGPFWSPSGRALAFLSDRDGSGIAKVWLWQRATGELARISEVCIRDNEIQWVGDHAVVVTICPEKSGQPQLAEDSRQRVRAAIASDRSKPTVKVYVSDQPSPAGSLSVEPWDLDAYLGDLAVIDVDTGAVRRLTQNQHIGKYLVSPDDSQIAFSSPVRFEQAGSQQIDWNLSVVSIPTGESRIFVSGIRLEYDGSPFSWAPDGSRVAYLAGGPLERMARGDCYVVDPKSGRSTNITMFGSPPGPEKQRAPLWGSGGRAIYFLRQGAMWKAEDYERVGEFSRVAGRRIVQLIGVDHRRLWSRGGATIVLTYDGTAKQSGFYRLDLETGKTSKLEESGRCYTCINADDYVFTAPGGDKLVFFAEDAQHSSDLRVVDFDSGHSQSLTHLNPQFDNYAMGGSRLVRWRDLDGSALEGALLLPAGYREGTRYPLIVWVYGGERGSDFVNHFGLSPGGPLNLQFLATRGYAVFFPDAPQDTTPMLDIAKCVLPGINQLIDQGIADPARIGVMGHSYGGYSALALIVETKRFKAAIEMNGTASLLSEYGEMDKDGTAFGVSHVEQGQGRMGGTPWQVRDRYIENSPFFYLDRVESPLLIVQGTEDATTAPFLADELYVALRRLGKNVVYAKYEGEGHSPLYWRYANRLDLHNRVISWLDEHLKDR